jgi:hypothetical protein
MTDAPRPDAQPPGPVPLPVEEQTRFYGEGDEYTNAQGIRYRQTREGWVLVTPPPAEPLA